MDKRDLVMKIRDKKIDGREGEGWSYDRLLIFGGLVCIFTCFSLSVWWINLPVLPVTSE
jgi:hypothetical protein